LVWYGLGRAQQTCGDPEAAVTSYERALHLQPDHRDARANLAAAYNFLGNYAAGEREARQVLQTAPRDPGAEFNLSVALLSTGQWPEGWMAYEARLQTRLLDGQRRRWTVPRWAGDGQPGDTILVHAEQGFGDTIQFARYLPRLTARGYRVVLQCPADLVLLLRIAGLCDDVRSFSDEAPEHQWHLPLTSLPFALGLHDDGHVFGTGAPYLRAPSANEGRARGGDQPDRLRIGLVWAGSPTHVNDMHRSCGFQALTSLFSISPIEWINLQLGPVGDVHVPDDLHFIDERDQLATFADTARALTTLDAVISVDSAVAHLAGALGVPCFLLLPKIGMDWRWAAEATGRFWYQSVHPVRQAQPGRWHEAIHSVGAALQRLLAERARP
jgi:hypothetical protein